ncbi:MAG: hypothetical protein WAV48_00500, partial [Candidatus Magasanikiibacteriota bacterium]
CESSENMNNVSTVTSSDINSALVEDIGVDGIISAVGASQLSQDTESAEYQEVNDILSNPEKIRGLLVSQGGMTVSEAAQIPDDKLLQLAKELWAEQLNQASVIVGNEVDESTTTTN